jgi:hypothetical protein
MKVQFTYRFEFAPVIIHHRQKKAAKKTNSRFANIYIGNVVLFIFVGLFIGILIVVVIIFMRIEIIIIRT